MHLWAVAADLGRLMPPQKGDRIDEKDLLIYVWDWDDARAAVMLRHRDAWVSGALGFGETPLQVVMVLTDVSGRNGLWTRWGGHYTVLCPDRLEAWRTDLRRRWVAEELGSAQGR